MPNRPQAGQAGEHKRGDYPPKAEVEARGHRSPYLLDEEAAETVEASYYDDCQKHEHDQQLPTSFKDHSAEDLVIRDLRAAGDDPAAYEFSYTGKYEVGDVSDVYAVEGCQAGDAVIDRQQKLAPAYSTKPECE